MIGSDQRGPVRNRHGVRASERPLPKFGPTRQGLNPRTKEPPSARAGAMIDRAGRRAMRLGALDYPRMKKAIGLMIRHFLPSAPILQIGRTRPDLDGNCFVTSGSREDVLRSVSRILNSDDIPPAAL